MESPYYDLIKMPQPIAYWHLGSQYEHWLDCSWQSAMNYQTDMIVGAREMRYAISEVVETFDIIWSTVPCVYGILDGRHYYLP